MGGIPGKKASYKMKLMACPVVRRLAIRPLGALTNFLQKSESAYNFLSCTFERPFPSWSFSAHLYLRVSKLGEGMQVLSHPSSRAAIVNLAWLSFPLPFEVTQNSSQLSTQDSSCQQRELICEQTPSYLLFLAQRGAQSSHCFLPLLFVFIQL